jgi:hypothetical protein
VDERAACALLKQRFEAAGFTIEDNRPFDEDGIRFEIDGFDPHRRVGYEYLSEEAGDSWDVDEAVIAALEERRKRGELHILIVDESHAPDPASLATAADAFLADLRARGLSPPPPATELAATTAPASTVTTSDIAPSDTPTPSAAPTTAPDIAPEPSGDAAARRAPATKPRTPKAKPASRPKPRSTKKKPARK